MLGPSSSSSSLLLPPSSPLSSTAPSLSSSSSSAPLLLRRFALPSLSGWSTSTSSAPPVPLPHAPRSSVWAVSWLLLAAAFVALNLCVSLWVIAHIDREKHHPAAAAQLAYTLSSRHTQRPVVATEGGLACPLTFPLTSCASSDATSTDEGGAALSLPALHAELQSSLRELQHLRSALSNLSATAADAASSPSSFPSSSLPFLYVGIPTVARSSAAAGWYLNASLHSILAQLPADPLHPLHLQVHVIVMNHSPADTPHPAFEQAKRELGSSPSSPFHFLTNPGLLSDAQPDARDAGSPNVPGWRVRKQTRDIVATLRAAQGRSRYYLFMEDDFTWCPHTLQLLQYMVDKGKRYHPHPFSYKMSFGMNGFMVANDNDLQHFAQYLLDHQRLRPPDHLLTEWSAGEKQSAAYKQGRPHMVYRYNLLHHLGTVSSLRDERNAEYPQCWHELNTEVVFAVESFRLNECDHDDLWPCWTREQVQQAKDERSHTTAWLEPFNIPDSLIEEAQK